MMLCCLKYTNLDEYQLSSRIVKCISNQFKQALYHKKLTAVIKSNNPVCKTVLNQGPVFEGNQLNKPNIREVLRLSE